MRSVRDVTRMSTGSGTLSSMLDRGRVNARAVVAACVEICMRLVRIVRYLIAAGIGFMVAEIFIHPDYGSPTGWAILLVLILLGHDIERARQQLHREINIELSQPGIEENSRLLAQILRELQRITPNNG